MATIRARGEKWQAVVRTKGRTASRCFLSKRDAEKWARQIETDIERGVFVDHSESEKTSLAEALQRYQLEISINHKGASQESLRIRAWLNDPLAKRPLSTLAGKDFAEWRDRRMAPGKKGVKPASASTVRNDLAIVSGVFEACRKDWGMHDLANPIKAMRLPKTPAGRDRVLSDAEVTAICNESESAELASLLRIALETAMRRSELCALEWRNIDLKALTATLDDTKNGSRRVVPLSTTAVAVLTSLARRIDGRVFSLRPNSITQAFTRAAQRAREAYIKEGGKDERFLVGVRWHDLRHTATTRLVTGGVFNVVEAAAITGHKDIKMLQRYSHPDPQELARRLG